MKIEIWSDFGCPFCYIGKARFEQALNQFEHKDSVEVIYKAYQLNPYAPKEMKGSAAEAFAQGHGMSVSQAKDRFKMFVENAKTAGLTYNYDIIQMTNTFDAHRLAKWANQFGLEPKLTSLLMKAYFTDGKNVADFSTLVAIAQEAGLNADEAKKVLEEGQFKDQVNAEINEARQVGVQGVPFFVINRKYGVSGAQATEYFLQALRQIYQEEQPLQKLEADDSATCDHDECGF
ncbi:MAG: DsbA family protein [Acholeplasmataceae bacterium]